MSSVRPSARAESIPANENSSPTNALKSNQANRVLNFAGANNRTRKSLYVEETQSPFKPRKALRRSQGPLRPDPFALQDSPEVQRNAHAPHDDYPPADEDVEQSIEDVQQDFDVPFADDADDSGMAQPMDNDADMNGTAGDLDASEMAATAESALARMRGQKRDRASLHGAEQAGQQDSSMVMTDSIAPPPKRKRGRPRKSDTIVETTADVRHIDQSQIATGDHSLLDNGEGPSTLNLSQGAEPTTDSSGAKRKRGRPPKDSKPKIAEQPKPSTEPPKPSQQSPSKSNARGASVGPVSNVHLRATTPFEDSQNHASRYGRNLIKPLMYWKNETRIYRNGNIEGIIRAEEAEIPKTPRGRKAQKRGRKPKQKLENIEEVSDTESILPDEWEDDRGVLAFDLANYDPETGTGDIDDAIRQGTFPIPSLTSVISVLCTNFSLSNADRSPFFTHLQISPFPNQLLSPATFRTPISATPKSSRCPSSAPAWSRSRRAASSVPKTAGACS
jgi:centromere protein C